ncbi:GNAT family N-acetyltransferase [Subtercola sp. YIM 133946]|uniref:GNAT family N-acetyltransferase n=1 Tax=Subtercola sp. YIM 133946 TaxID=3118909 RepID=UPI002F93D960
MNLDTARSIGTTPPRFELRVPLDADAEAWFHLFDDPEIMRYVGGGAVQPLLWYRDFVVRQQGFAATLGVCLFALVVPGPTGEWTTVDGTTVDGTTVAGFVGLQPWSRPWGPPLGRLEIGWRLGAEFHGRGLATAGAREALARGVAAGVESPIAMIDELNGPSIAVATKLGMTRLDLFDAPDSARVGMWGF